MNSRAFCIFLIFAIALLTIFSSCERSTSDNLGWRFELERFSESTPDCVKDFEMQVGDRVINMYHEMSIRRQIGDTIIMSRDLGYYCPCNSDCSVFDEFRERYIAGEMAITEPLLSIDMYTSCQDFIDRPEFQMICAQDRTILDGLPDRFRSIGDSDYISDDEKEFIARYLEDYFSNPYDVDFCKYLDDWDKIDKSSSIEGLISASLLIAPHAMLDGRGELLAGWTNVNPEEKVHPYFVFMLVRFGVGAILNSIEKDNDDVPEDPGDGNMIFGDALEDTVRGI